MLQKERKSGRWQVERLQFLQREQRGLHVCVTGRNRFAALGFANGHIFLPLTTQRMP